MVSRACSDCRCDAAMICSGRLLVRRSEGGRALLALSRRCTEPSVCDVGALLCSENPCCSASCPCLLFGVCDSSGLDAVLMREDTAACTGVDAGAA